MRIGALVLLAALAFGAALVLDVGGLQARLFADEPVAKVPPVPKLPAAASPEPSAPITPAWYLGQSGYEGAELERQSARASMIVYFQKRRCDACRKFEREVLSSPEVKAFLGEVVKVRADLSDESRLAARFGVRSVPAVVVVPQRGPPRALPPRALATPSLLIAFTK